LGRQTSLSQKGQDRRPTRRTLFSNILAAFSDGQDDKLDANVRLIVPTKSESRKQKAKREGKRQKAKGKSEKLETEPARLA
jgi:hypothetical protein